MQNNSFCINKTKIISKLGVFLCEWELMIEHTEAVAKVRL